MSTPAVQLLVSVNGGAFTTGAIAGGFGQVVAMQAASTLPLTSVIYEIYEYPAAFTVPSGWSTDPVTGTYYYAPTNVTTPPPTFTIGTSNANNWGLFMLRMRGNNNPLQLNADGTPNTAFSPQLTDTSTCVDVSSPNLGFFGIAAGLTTQLDTMRGWVGPVMQALRLLDNVALGGGTFSAGGDLGGSSISQIVNRIHGATVPIAGALVTGAVLTVTGPSALAYSAINLASGAAVSGVLPVANGGTALSSVGANGTVLTVVSGAPAWVAPAAGAFVAGGDLGGTPTNQNVLAVHGASVPIAGGLTVGSLLTVTGASSLGYAPLNLAGGGSYVTGLLPAANQAPQTLSGQVTGAASATVVVQINGATVPAAGALTVGNVLQASGASAVSYGPINLANSNSVGGSLAVSNGGTGLGALGSADQLLGMNHAGSALAFFTAGGDATLASGSFKITALQGFSIATSTPTSGQVLTWNAGTSKWTATTAGGSASVTGSGVWHSTSGTLDAAASAGTAGQSLFTNAGATDTAWTTFSGDVTASTGTPGAITVTRIQGHGVASTAPTTGQYLTQGASTWGPVSLSGDVSGSSVTAGLTTVIALQGFSIATSTPTSGQLLTWNAGTSKWTATSPAAGTSVTGSGVWHTTGGTLDAAASKGTAGQFLVTNTGATDTAWASIAGDASGSTGTPGSLSVTGLRGNPISASAATAGQVLIENAAATGSAWTGLSGDVTLSTSTPGAATVLKINAATVPAAGALVNGNSLYVSGVTTLSYSALNLAGGSGWVTGALPIANGGTGISSLGAADALIGVNHAGTALTYFLLGGDGSLASGSLTVTGIRGNAVPSLASGFLQWTGSAFAWAAPAGIAVTGSGVWHSTSGTLDGAASKGTAGQALFTNAAATDTVWVAHTGDVTNSTSTPGQMVVAKINGATVPASGSLTTGNVLQVSGSATLTYAALNLALAASVTGVLPAGNQAAQTMGGDVTGTTAASIVSKISGTSPIAITPANLQWLSTTAAPTISQVITASAVPAVMTLSPQQSSNASGNGATLAIALGSPTGTGQGGYVHVTGGGGDLFWLGGVGSTGLANAQTPSLYMGVSPTSAPTAWVLQTVGSILGINAPGSGGDIRFNVNGTIAFKVNSATNITFFNGNTAISGSGTNVIGLGNASGIPTVAPSGGLLLYANSGALEAWASAFQFNQGQATPTVGQRTKGSDAATTSLTVKAQDAFASSTGSNRTGGALLLKGGANAAGGNPGTVSASDGGSNFFCDVAFNQADIRNAAGTVGCFVGSTTAVFQAAGGTLQAGPSSITMSSVSGANLTCNASADVIVQSGVGGSAAIGNYLSITPSGTTGSQVGARKQYCAQGQITTNGGQINLDIPLPSTSGCVINYTMQARCTTAGSTMAVGDSLTSTGTCSFFVNGSGTAVAYAGNGNHVTIIATNPQGAGFSGASATPIALPAPTLGSARLSWLIAASTGTLGFCDCTIWADVFLS